MNEADYERGSRAAWQMILSQAIQALGQEAATKEGWRLEREAAVAALRDVCEHHGDNDWSADLDLADVIEKHLARHLSHE